MTSMVHHVSHGWHAPGCWRCGGFAQGLLELVKPAVYSGTSAAGVMCLWPQLKAVEHVWLALALW